MAIRTFKAGEDLTGKTGFAVKAHTTDGEVVLAEANDVCLGLLVNDNTSGRSVSVALNGQGEFKGKLGGAVSFGDYLEANAYGELVEAAGAGEHNVIAQALSDGADTQLIYVDIVKLSQTLS